MQAMIRVARIAEAYRRRNARPPLASALSELIAHRGTQRPGEDAKTGA